MKKLYFLRHAKSDWSDMMLSDHERPLNGRGRRACVKIGLALLQRKVSPGLVLCSTATRARETLERVMSAGALDWPVSFQADLYGASADRILSLVRQQSDDHESLLLVGHNPGFQDLVLGLTGEEVSEGMMARIARKMPTAAFAELAFDCRSFQQISLHTGRLEQFFKPKDKTIV